MPVWMSTVPGQTVSPRKSIARDRVTHLAPRTARRPFGSAKSKARILEQGRNSWMGDVAVQIRIGQPEMFEAAHRTGPCRNERRLWLLLNPGFGMGGHGMAEEPERLRRQHVRLPRAGANAPGNRADSRSGADRCGSSADRPWPSAGTGQWRPATPRRRRRWRPGSGPTPRPPQTIAVISTSSRSPPRNRLGRCKARCSGVRRNPIIGSPLPR
jgi:hypothetical protein